VNDYPYASSYSPDEPAQDVARMAVYPRLMPREKGQTVTMPATREDWAALLDYILALWRRRAMLCRRMAGRVGRCQTAERTPGFRRKIPSPSGWLIR